VGISLRGQGSALLTQSNGARPWAPTSRFTSESSRPSQPEARPDPLAASPIFRARTTSRWHARADGCRASSDNVSSSDYPSWSRTTSTAVRSAPGRARDRRPTEVQDSRPCVHRASNTAVSLRLARFAETHSGGRDPGMADRSLPGAPRGRDLAYFNKRGRSSPGGMLAVETALGVTAGARVRAGMINGEKKTHSSNGEERHEVAGLW